MQKFCKVFCNPILQTQTRPKGLRLRKMVLIILSIYLDALDTLLKIWKQPIKFWNSIQSLETEVFNVLKQPSSMSSNHLQSLKSFVKGLGLCLLYCHYITTTLNFSNTYRGPTNKCYTFLETSHDPWHRSQLISFIMMFLTPLRNIVNIKDFNLQN